MRLKGDIMQRPYSYLSILILAALLAGCAASASVQSQEIKSVDGNNAPTDSPDRTASNSSDPAQSEIVPHDPPASCPVTVPQDPRFIAPEPYSQNAPFEYDFWFGSENLWTMLPKDGIWHSLPHNPEGYTQKVFWWREGYIWNEEPEPALTVTGERLDASAPPLLVSRATNAYAGDIGSAMLVGVDFPTLGCWKITGQYAEAELSFVIWVAP